MFQNVHRRVYVVSYLFVDADCWLVVVLVEVLAEEAGSVELMESW
jgi:hypothetical protein